MLSRFYVQATFSSTSKESGIRLVRDVRDSMIDRFNVALWMGESAKEVARDKARKIEFKMGYPSTVCN